MSMIWRWFFRFVVVTGLLFAALLLLLVFDMSRPNVDQSEGYVARTPDAIACTLSKTLPDSASQVRFRRASVGMGGRLLLYRFTAPIDDLHLHAETEFNAHWDHPGFTATPNSPSPFDLRDVKRNSVFYGGDTNWMLPPDNAVGTIYAPQDGRSSHRPLIFVDEANGVLYFQMTD